MTEQFIERIRFFTNRKSSPDTRNHDYYMYGTMLAYIGTEGTPTLVRPTELKADEGCSADDLCLFFVGENTAHLNFTGLTSEGKWIGVSISIDGGLPSERVTWAELDYFPSFGKLGWEN